jgi:uncharacterized protein YndB with AHSA1/START domain
MSGRQVIERVWNAPIELIWELWTDPAGRASWWGPRGFTVEIEEMDVRVGGAFRYTMRATSPEMVAAMQARGRPTAHSIACTFTQVDAPNRLEWASPFGPDTLTTSVEFTQLDEGVKMVLVLDATKPEMTGGAAMGWKGSLDRFAERLDQV